MYLLPIYIKRYSSKINSNLFVSEIRFNTFRSSDGNNFRGLLYRKETEKFIILKDVYVNPKFVGGVTLVSIAENGENDIVITTIAYHDIVGTLWFLMFVIIAINELYKGQFHAIPILLLPFLMNMLHYKSLKRHREFIEAVISDCENKSTNF